MPPTTETLQPKHVVFAAGKNLGVESTQEDIRNDPWHLSAESRVTARAAGMLWKPGTDIVLITGRTAGPDMPAESEAQKAYIMFHFPHIPEENLIPRTKSNDSGTDAKDAAEYIREQKERGRVYEKIDLLTVGYHIKNYATLFKRRGVRIDQRLASEEVVRGRSRSSAVFVEKRAALPRMKKEEKKEAIRGLLLHVDRRGWLLHLLTSVTRR